MRDKSVRSMASRSTWHRELSQQRYKYDHAHALSSSYRRPIGECVLILSPHFFFKLTSCCLLLVADFFGSHLFLRPSLLYIEITIKEHQRSGKISSFTASTELPLRKILQKCRPLQICTINTDALSDFKNFTFAAHLWKFSVLAPQATGRVSFRPYRYSFQSDSTTALTPRASSPLSPPHTQAFATKAAAAATTTNAT